MTTIPMSDWMDAQGYTEAEWARAIGDTFWGIDGDGSVRLPWRSPLGPAAVRVGRRLIGVSAKQLPDDGRNPADDMGAWWMWRGASGQWAPMGAGYPDEDPIPAAVLAVLPALLDVARECGLSD